MPYHRTVSMTELSPKQQELAQQIGTKDAAFNQTRLIADFYERKNYVIHFRYLQECLKLGVVITAVHNALLFKQDQIFLAYVKAPTSLRQDSQGRQQYRLPGLRTWCLCCKSSVRSEG